ncbi:hypothetical protein ACROYT_G014628 [Oculina patagonica]
MYKCNNKEQLEELCRKERIPTEGKKHYCVQRLVEKMGDARPPLLKDYKGSLRCIPASITDIAKLSIYKLKEILRFHNVLDCATKDELVVRVGMVRAGRGYLAFHRETEAIRNLIIATRNIIIAEKELYLEDPKVIHKRRKFTTKSGPSLETERPRDSASIPHQNQSAFLPVPIGCCYYYYYYFYYCWYKAEVQSYDDDEIELVYDDEPECLYRIPVLPSVVSGTLRLKQSLF